jgi:hypothetical protein
LVIPSERQRVEESRIVPADEPRASFLVQKRTQISQITLTAQMGSCGLTEFICVICEISAICVRFWNDHDAGPVYRDDSRFLDFAPAALRSE